MINILIYRESEDDMPVEVLLEKENLFDYLSKLVETEICSIKLVKPLTSEKCDMSIIINDLSLDDYWDEL